MFAAFVDPCVTPQTLEKVISGVANISFLNAHLRNDLKQSGVHQTGIAFECSLSPVTRLPGGEVLETMKSH